MAALAGFSGPALAQVGPSIPSDLPGAVQIGEPQRKTIQEFVAARRDELLKGEEPRIQSARRALLGPLGAREVSLPFRREYASAWQPVVDAMVKDTQEFRVVNGLRIAGELAVPASVGVIRTALSDQRPAVRYAAAFGAGRLFEEVDRQTPAIAAAQLNDLLTAISGQAGKEADTFVLDGLMLAMAASTKVRQTQVADFRSGAFIAVANAASARAKAIPEQQSQIGHLAVIVRALRATRDAITNVGEPKLSAPANAAGAGFAKDVQAMVERVKAKPELGLDESLLNSAMEAAKTVEKLAGQ